MQPDLYPSFNPNHDFDSFTIDQRSNHLERSNKAGVAVFTVIGALVFTAFTWTVAAAIERQAPALAIILRIAPIPVALLLIGNLARYSRTHYYFPRQVKRFDVSYGDGGVPGAGAFNNLRPTSGSSHVTTYPQPASTGSHRSGGGAPGTGAFHALRREG